MTDDVSHLAEQISEFSDINRRLRRKIFDLYTVFEISRNLSSMLNTESLINGILLTCMGQIGVKGVVIFTTDNDYKYLTNPRSKGIDIESLKNTSIKLNSPLARVLLKSAKPLTSVQLSSLLSKHKKELDFLNTFNIKLAAPMIMRSPSQDNFRLLGVLFLLEKITKADFYEDDIEFLTLLMNQLAVALENARLYEIEHLMNEEIKRTQKLLVESEKMAALGKLSASIAHEVNNPLGIINNYLQILSMQTMPDDVYKNYIKILKDEVKRIAGIVRQLLDFYKPEQEQVGDVDLRKILPETLELLSNQLSKSRIVVRLDIDRDVPLIKASAEKLKQVFLNLIMNSKYFMPESGEIKIRIIKNTPNVEIEISDTGPGIPEENLSKIFEPFFTTKKGDGTGLGLFVCYGIIQWHRGNITVRNNVDKGTTFHITLPITRKDD